MLNHQAVDRVFQALGDPTRRAIVDRLSRGSTSVSALAEPLKLTLAAVVQHVQTLEECGIVRTEKIGRVRSCHLRPQGLEVAESWIAARRRGWEAQFDRLGELLDGPAAKKPRRPR